MLTLIESRFEELRRKHNLSEKATESEEPSAAVAAYWHDCLQSLRDLKICDPACGSGAFLIQAYDVLEERYTEIIHNVATHEGPKAELRLDEIPDMILNGNLYGVDLSQQAVEITQLALWIRSAQKGKTLADLSHNIVWGNSLVSDAAIQAQGFDWKEKFPEVFNRPLAGFDCVIGNPPWERLKLQEREFFAFSRPEIAARWRRQAQRAYRRARREESGAVRPVHGRQASGRRDTRACEILRPFPAHGQGRRQYVHPVR